MDISTAQELARLTTDFYARVSDSFSATRQSPWQGWGHVRALMRTALPPVPRILDLACGNMRFEKYLLQSYEKIDAHAVDNCDSLATSDIPAGVTFQHLDMLHELLCENDLSSCIRTCACDLSVCFGFMHHVALPEHRVKVLRALVEHTRPGGLVAVSFWQFAKEPRILAKAQPLADEGDYLLGWQHEADVARYCHSFTDQEIDALVATVAPQATEVDRFWADGKSHNLNCYVTLSVG